MNNYRVLKAGNKYLLQLDYRKFLTETPDFITLSSYKTRDKAEEARQILMKEEKQVDEK